MPHFPFVACSPSGPSGAPAVGGTPTPVCISFLGFRSGVALAFFCVRTFWTSGGAYCQCPPPPGSLLDPWRCLSLTALPCLIFFRLLSWAALCLYCVLDFWTSGGAFRKRLPPPQWSFRPAGVLVVDCPALSDFLRLLSWAALCLYGVRAFWAPVGAYHQRPPPPVVF